MGVVYKAEDTRLHRFVALKFLPEHFARDPQRVMRFEREAQAASTLNHPNICTIYDIDEHEGNAFIAMEFLEGHTLKHLIGAAPFRTDQILDLGTDIADALETAHGNGIVHRDVKPANIFVTQRGQAKLLDFGVAKLCQELRTEYGGRAQAAMTVDRTLTASGVALGTVAYMSPEQVKGEEPDPRTHHYTPPVVLNEKATRLPPYKRNTSEAISAAILHDSPAPLSQLNPALPAKLDEIINKALEKNRDLRYQHAADIRSDLQSLEQDASLDAAFKRLRFALDDNADKPLFIETAPKQGHRFISPVQAVKTARRLTIEEGKIAEPVGAASASSSRRTILRVLRPWLVSALALAIVAGTYWLRPLSPPLQVTSVVQLSKRGAAWRLENLLEDDRRLFYTERTGSSTFQLRQIALDGNDTPVVGLPADSLIRGLSADHTTFLMRRYPITADPPHPFWTVPVVGGAPRRLGNFLADEADLSRDGRSLAYTRSGQLFLANADGTGERLLADFPGFYVYYMRWSPDGRSIRFTVKKNEEYTIWEVGTDSRNLHPVNFNWPGTRMERSGDWTRDGRYYLFVSRRNGISNLWAIEEHSDWMHRPRHKPVQLTAGPMDYYRPLPSSDGTRLFAVATRHLGQLLRYDTVRKQFGPFMGGASVDRVSFSHDGQWVAYVSYPEATLWRARRDGSEALQLTFPPLGVVDLRWSPDGKRIAFSAQQPGEPLKIELISRDGGNSTPLLQEPYYQHTPSWSAQGNFLVYTRCFEVDPPIECALYRFDLAAKIARKIPGSDGLYFGVLAPEGRHLAAVEVATRRVFLVDLLSGQRTQLTRSHPEAAFPIWSNDSRYVYFNDLMSPEPAIFRVYVRDAREEKVTDVSFTTEGASLGFWSGLAPDGSPLLLRNREQSDVYVLSLARP